MNWKILSINPSSVAQKTAAQTTSQQRGAKAQTLLFKKPKVIGYLCVSSGEQELEKNKAGILPLANNYDLGKVEFVEEKASDKAPWRKSWVAEILNELRRQDVLVRELSRH